MANHTTAQIRWAAKRSTHLKDIDGLLYTIVECDDYTMCMKNESTGVYTTLEYIQLSMGNVEFFKLTPVKIK